MKFGVIEKQILTLSEEQLVTSIGKKTSSATKKVSIFNETILNVLNIYIPHETRACYDKDPPWFNSRIKFLLQDKNKLYKDFRRSNTNAQLLNKLNRLQE